MFCLPSREKELVVRSNPAAAARVNSNSTAD
jgi:hypothetical protein